MMYSAVRQKQNRQTHTTHPIDRHRDTHRQTQAQTDSQDSLPAGTYSDSHTGRHTDRQRTDRQHREQEVENSNLDSPSAKGLQEEVLLFLPLM